MRKIIIAAILAAVSTSAAADTQIDVLRADLDLRHSIERFATVGSGGNVSTLDGYRLKEKFVKSVTPAIVEGLNNSIPCEMMAAETSQRAFVLFGDQAKTPLAKSALDNMAGKMAVYVMAKFYDLKG